MGTHHDSLAFKAAGVGGPVGPDETVDAELGVMHRVAEVTPVAPVLDFLAALHSLGHNALVHPVPDEPALHGRVADEGS